jgi:phosphopantothenoylcysteine decarboxylase/phosphopantothenate--cysteine ligase
VRFLVSAGPTREPIDGVRFISNPSTGKMGYAVASAASAKGQEVLLVSGPTSLSSPDGVERIEVETADDMLRAITAGLPSCDALVMCAAVSDMRPSRPASGKLKKTQLPDAIQIEPTPDILTELLPLKQHRVYVGFAAEVGNPVEEAKRKLVQKGLDLIVANDISRPDSGFGTDTNQALLIDKSGAVRDLPLMSKLDLAREIVVWIEAAAQC